MILVVLTCEISEFHVWEVWCPVCCFGCCYEKILFEGNGVDKNGEWAEIMFNVLWP